MIGRSQRIGFESLVGLVAAAFAWTAVASWKGMVAEPSQYLGPAAVAALLLAATGAAGRSLRLRWYATLAVQLVVVLVWFHHRQNGDGFAAGWIPTPGGLAEVVDQVRDGSSAINTYAAPVSATYVEAPVYLIACAVLVLVLIDLIACGLRLPAWAGLPALVAVTIPISILDEGLPTGVYLATGILYAVLLAVVEAGRTIAWGPSIPEAGTGTGGDLRLPLLALGAPAVLIGAGATLLALVVSLGVPVGKGLFHPGDGAGDGRGGGGRVTLNNPLVDLRRDLVRNDGVPLLQVETEARDVSYLRLTILDSFVDDTWTPSPRDLAESNRADGRLPLPEGLAAEPEGRTSTWSMSTSDDFSTTWLPLPAVAQDITIFKGDWRYDPRFVDIANTDDPAPTQVDYQVAATPQTYSAADLAAAPPSSPALIEAMTRLPQLPQTVVDIAQQVTAGGRTDHAKAVLLQNWFRSDGGFTYSLDAAPGEGMDQLTRFVTTDKVGYCEQFAAAMALMARSIGLPARVAVGFLDPSDSEPGSYLFTSDDLHAWPEIYFAGAGWVRFEPTPGARTGSSPPWTRNEVEAPEPSASASPTTSAPTREPTRAPQPEPVAPETTQVGDDSGAPVVALSIVGGAVVLLLLAAPALVRSGQRRRRLRPTGQARADLGSLWAELRATALDLGVPWPEGLSPRMTGEELRTRMKKVYGITVRGEDLVALELLVRLDEEARYRETFVLDAEDGRRAAEAGRRWVALLQETVRPRRLWLARVAPRSVVTGRRTDTDEQVDQTDELTETSLR